MAIAALPCFAACQRASMSPRGLRPRLLRSRSPCQQFPRQFPPLHRSFAPICTFALHVPPPATRGRHPPPEMMHHPILNTLYSILAHTPCPRVTMPACPLLALCAKCPLAALGRAHFSTSSKTRPSGFESSSPRSWAMVGATSRLRMRSMTTPFLMPWPLMMKMASSSGSLLWYPWVPA